MPLYRLLNSGNSERRAARLLNIHRITVARRVKRFGWKTRGEQRDFIKSLSTKKVQNVQIDEMETHIHTKLKPVSIAIAVDADTRKILGFQVSTMPARGPNAWKSRQKYGPRPDQRLQGMNRLLEQIKPAIAVQAVFTSDLKTSYPNHIKRHFPEAEHIGVKGRRGCVVGQGELKKIGFDPLFALNHTCAMIRDNVKCLSRRTWCTSKTVQGLIDRLSMYVNYHNTILT